METACDVVLGHYSLLDVMTSDRACVGPVERGAWRWGSSQTADLWSTQVKMAGVARLRGLTRKGCGLEEGMIRLYNVQNSQSWPPRDCVAVSQIRATSHAFTVADPKQLNGHHKWFLWPMCCY